MKRNIQKVNLHGIPKKLGKWWSYTTTCDICSTFIDYKISNKKPKDKFNEIDICSECKKIYEPFQNI